MNGQADGRPWLTMAVGKKMFDLLTPPTVRPAASETRNATVS